jgi:ATPase family associated with various cellular activities (AAA)
MLDPLEIELVRGWHCVGDSGTWDIVRLRSDLRTHLVHSNCRGIASVNNGPARTCQHLVFAKQNVFVAVSSRAPECHNLRVWARDPEDAEAQFAELHSRYFRERIEHDTPANFFVLTASLGDMEARRVTAPLTVQSPDDLRLHYGEDFELWHREFVKMLSTRRHGLTIFQGPPGTGKTTYLRHLLYQFRKTHRFYYLPLPVYPALSSPAFVDFWISENERHKRSTKVVVLEDAEPLVAQRDPESQEMLSTLLNIGDGFLGDFLCLHLICTINTPMSRLDPAVKRSGRLIAARKFNRLSWPQAQRLAQARGITLEVRESYSLAEIYASSSLAADLNQNVEPKVGFAA